MDIPNFLVVGYVHPTCVKEVNAKSM